MDSLASDASSDERSLHAFLQACRDVSGAQEDTSRLVERSLAASTREDLSWRGDMRDTARFLRDRLRSSAALRLAAASLLLHLAALPVVALYVLTEESEPPRFFVDNGQRAAPFTQVEEPEGDAGLEIAEPQLGDPLLAHNSLSWGRYHLDSSAQRLPSGPASIPAWLAPRFDVLYGPASSVLEPLELREPQGWLALEVLMDQLVVEPPRASDAIDVSEALEALAGLMDFKESDAAWLIASTLARAESYGLSTARAAAALKSARQTLPREDRRRALIEVDGDLRAIMPLDVAWLEAVRAYDPGSLSDATLDLFRALQRSEPR